MHGHKGLLSTLLFLIACPGPEIGASSAAGPTSADEPQKPSEVPVASNAPASPPSSSDRYQGIVAGLFKGDPGGVDAFSDLRAAARRPASIQKSSAKKAAVLGEKEKSAPDDEEPLESCSIVLGASPQQGELDTKQDDELRGPPWVVSGVKGLFGLGAAAFGQPKDFRPPFVINPTARPAAFTWQDAKVRVHPDLFGAPSVLPEAEAERVGFTLGVLAHEFGHYADSRLQMYDRFVSTVPELRAQPMSRIHRKELFADAVAGCILARMDETAAPLVTFFTAHAARAVATHPAPDLRLVALKAGHARCSSNRPFPKAIDAMFEAEAEADKSR